MEVNKNIDIFLSLIRAGIGHQNSILQPHVADWDVIKMLSDQHGLTAIVLDALNTRGDELTRDIPVQMKLEWIGDVLQNYEQRYKQYEKSIGSLAGFYNQLGFKMMVLKGYVCSLNWPKPEHRPCGDIDIWLFGKQKEADKALTGNTGIRIDGRHHHHTVFEWQGFTVENHYDFVNVHAHKSSRVLEPIFKELGKDDSYSVDVNGEKVYIPSANLHALFLMRHLANHFASAEINIRQVLDWAFFVEKHTKEIDWKWLEGLLEKFHMKDFYNCINAICVGDLGFDVRIFLNVQFDPALKDKVLADILSPEWAAAEPQGFYRRMAYKYRRWQGNAWKQELCYPESRLESFFTGLWSHIITPKGV